MIRALVVVACVGLISCEDWELLEREACRKSNCDGGFGDGGVGGGGVGGGVGGGGVGGGGVGGGGVGGGGVGGGGVGGGVGGGGVGGGGVGGGGAGGGGGAVPCPAFDGGTSGTLNYRRSFPGAANEVAVVSIDCKAVILSDVPDAGLRMRTMALDNSNDGGVEVVIPLTTPRFAVAGRNGVVAIARDGLLDLRRSDGTSLGTASTGSSEGAVALLAAPTGLKAMVHGYTTGSNTYAWTVVDTATSTVLDAGLSACIGIRPSRVAVLPTEEHLLAAGRVVSTSTCTLLNKDDGNTGNDVVRALFTGALGVLEQNRGSINSPKVLVGAAENIGVFVYEDLSVNDQKVTLHVLDGGLPIGNQIMILDRARIVEVLVGPGGVTYLVGTTNGGTGTLGAKLGASYTVENDGGGFDPFVAKLHRDAGIAWVTNFGGPSDEVATRAVLTADGRLLVVGKCMGSGISSLCNGSQFHWLVSLTP